MNIDYKDFSHQLDGHWEEILAQYGIEVPQMRGINSKNGECPLCGGDDRAHWRDVGGRLCLFCRHCAADSMHPPENVIMEYAHLSFGELVKELADYVNHVPIERLRTTSKRVRAPKFNLPCDDKRDEEKSRQLIARCVKSEVSDCDVYEFQDCQHLVLKSFDGRIVNVARLGRDIQFVAGGMSYGASTAIKKSESTDYLVVASVWDARAIAEMTAQNVLIAFTPANIKYLCWHHPDSITCKPVLTVNDQHSDTLCHSMDWVFYDIKTKALTDKLRGQDLPLGEGDGE